MGPRMRIHAVYGTPEFDAEYRAALQRQALPAAGKHRDGTLAWLIERYRETSAGPTCRRLPVASARTSSSKSLRRRQSALRVDHSQGGIVAARDKRAATPYQARHFLDAMRGVFRWALAAGFVKVDPTAGVKNPKRKKGDGFRPGPRMMSRPISSAGRSARGSGCGSTCCSTPGCGAAMRCGLAASMCATGWHDPDRKERRHR